MTSLITFLLIFILVAGTILERAKEIDRQDEVNKRLERLEKRQNIQETGVTNMAAMTDTNVVFRCNKQFKASIEDWAKEHELNLSEACRNLINLELSKKQTLVDSLSFSLNYVNYLKSQGLIAADATDEQLANAAADFTAYLGNLDKQ